jgi:hypothetical protein
VLHDAIPDGPMVSSQSHLSVMSLSPGSPRDGALARFFGVHGSTIRRWKSQKPEFCAAVERGRLHFDCLVAEKLYERATGRYQWVEEQAVVCKEARSCRLLKPRGQPLHEGCYD